MLTSTQKIALGWLTLFLGLGLLFWLLAPVLTPFIVAAVAAYALHPVVEALVRRRWPRTLAVVVVETSLILALLALVLLVVPILTHELPQLRDQIPVLAQRLNTEVVPWLQKWGLPIQIDAASVKAFVAEHLQANGEDIARTLFSSLKIGGSVLMALVGNAVLMPVVLFYLLLDWPALVARVHALIPPSRQAQVLGLLSDIDDVLGQYLRGQLMVMGSLALYYTVGLWLFGFDLALPVGVFTGLAVFIPYLGFGLGLALALLAGMLQFASVYGLVAVAVVYGLGQLLESFVLTPRLVGERIGMNPLMVIFALLAFGHLFGFIGVLVALPVSAVLVVAVRRLHQLYLNSVLYRR